MHILLNVKNSGSWFNKFILKQCTWKSKAGRIKPVMLSSNFLSRWKCCEDTIAGILYCCSVTQLCPTLHNPMDCSTPGLLIPHRLLEFAQVHVHCIGDAIQSSHPLLPSSAFNLYQHQGLFQWVGCLPQVTKVLELQLQRHSFQWVFRVDFL